MVYIDIYSRLSLWLISYYGNKSTTHSMLFALAYVSKLLPFAPKQSRSIYSAKMNNNIWNILM